MCVRACVRARVCVFAHSRVRIFILTILFSARDSVGKCSVFYLWVEHVISIFITPHKVVFNICAAFGAVDKPRAIIRMWNEVVILCILSIADACLI